MAAGYFGGILNSLTQRISGAIQKPGQFDVFEIPPANLINFVRCSDDKLIQQYADSVYVMKNQKTEEYHVVICFRKGTDAKSTKIFSVYRERLEPLTLDVANRFRTHFDLVNLAVDDQKLKQIIECFHAHPTWDSVHVAAALGLTGFYTYLKDKGELKRINAVCPQTGALPIHIAAEYNQLQAVECLLSLGADVKKVDLNGMNVFHYAAGVSGRIIQALAKHPDGLTAINVTNTAGKTPLYIAIVVGKLECVLALITVGATGNIRSDGKTVLEVALDGSSTQKAQIVEAVANAFPFLLIEPGSDGSTPLHSSGRRKIDPKVMKSLIRATSKNPVLLSIRDSKGETPLHSAIRRADLPAIVCLIAHGSNVDDRNAEGQTSLHLALSLVKEAGQLLILKALLIFDADTSIPDSQGRLPRHVACTMDNPLRDRVIGIFRTSGAARCPQNQMGCVDTCRYLETGNHLVVKNEGLNEMRQMVCISRTLEKKKQNKRKLANLLALDGGGVKGIVLIQVLLALEKLVGTGNLLQCFDWVAGTSTGAIVAAAFCTGRSLRDVQRMYFCLKDTVMDTTVRPYNSTLLEQFLKGELGVNTKIGDILKPKLLITTVRADMNPVRLLLLRNYQLPLSEEENIALGYEDTRAWPLWKAVRCSSAAPTYFDSVDNRYVDGGLIANNPTLDLLTEVANYNFAAEAASDHNSLMEIGCVVSIGCGEMPLTPIRCVMDVRLPSGVIDAVATMFTMKNWGEVLINQATATDGRPVDRSRAWCHSLNIPFFRFSPPLFKDVPLDTTDDVTLIETLWCTVEYLHTRRSDLNKLVELFK